ncbi:aspartyl protease family protein [Kordiimonas sp. SCSIO 12603]|uniref:aspartyl protease family protein n=1 Tax=Kordiimonas sp. SCSIO 12603 TaxID=2829596 RepID=UPI002105D820|nr:aspartyl protease family protein [Kordiimonas sp. SCSIO 12603]UTW60161.1 aspartyl protease family protein [Kordiimonas sp. SCSIO 12603]
MHQLERDAYGRLMVGVHVNGEGPFPFILDTGASRSVIYRSLTALMDIQAVPFKSRSIVTARGYRRVQVFDVRDLFALGQTLQVEDTVALPDVIGSQAKGLIGVDVLTGKTLLMKPKDDLAVLLDSSDDFREEDGWSYIQGRPVAYGSLALEIEIGGVTVPLIVDTGASHTVINTSGAEAMARSGIEEKETSARIAGTRSTKQMLVPDLVLGDLEIGNAELYVADIPVFVLLGASNVPAMILGMDVLGEHEFAIDFKTWRLYIKNADRAGKQ